MPYNGSHLTEIEQKYEAQHQRYTRGILVTCLNNMDTLPDYFVNKLLLCDRRSAERLKYKLDHIEERRQAGKHLLALR